jgi:copper chaperone CopZ
MLTLKVTGMSCAHCEAAVKKAVGALSGVKFVAVNLYENIVTVKGGDRQAVIEAIEGEGYIVVN